MSPHREDFEEEERAPYEGWTFATDSDGDLRMTEMNRLSIAHDARATQQVLKTSLGTVKGEDRLDPEFGLDVFEATRSVPHLKREIRRTLLHDDKFHDRVDSVPVVDVDVGPNRHADVHIEAVLKSGERQVWNFLMGGVL